MPLEHGRQSYPLATRSLDWGYSHDSDSILVSRRQKNIVTVYITGDSSIKCQIETCTSNHLHLCLPPFSVWKIYTNSEFFDTAGIYVERFRFLSNYIENKSQKTSQFMKDFNFFLNQSNYHQN